MDSISGTVVDFISNLALEFGKDQITNKLDKKTLHSELEDYIKRQEKYNEICSYAEEIDFSSLEEFLKNNLLKELSNNIFSPDKQIRERTLNKIVGEATTYSKANTNEAKKRIRFIIENCLSIIQGFFEKKMSEKDLILGVKVTDAVNKHTNEVVSEKVDELSKKLDEQQAEIINIVHNNSTTDLNQMISEIKKGCFSKANDHFKTELKCISAGHPLFPYYGFTYDGEKIISKPLTQEATTKYPPIMTVSGQIRLDKKVFSDPSDILDYSYRHQKVLVIDVKKAEKFLGNMLDPIQDEAQKLIGGEIQVYPKEFPPAFPCSIIVGEKVFFEYILLRTQEILDDGTYIINNTEQENTHVIFEFREKMIELIKKRHDKILPTSEEIGFKIKIYEMTNKEYLNFIHFMYALSSNKEFRVHILEINQDLLIGRISDTGYKTTFPSITDEIDFYERVCSIEEYFNITIKLNQTISKKDFDSIMFVSSLIKNDKVYSKWEKLYLHGELDSSFRNFFSNISTNSVCFSCTMKLKVEICNVFLDLSVFRVYYDAHIEDLERIDQLIKLSKDGDPIRLSLISGKDNKVIDTLKIPENLSDWNTNIDILKE